MLNTTNYQGVFHESVTFSLDCDFSIENGEEVFTYQEGDELTLTADSELMSNGRIKILPGREHGKTSISSIKRGYGVPKYRGIIEISKGEKGLIIINELSIEEYLYSVVPSEMPTSYGNEALKVQAVCARSYAFNQLYANKYSSYGAHVDDSVSCQVYNNIEENNESILAVKDTYGKVLTQNGNVITSFYFSTSCGHTADYVDVWENAVETPYLSGVLQTEDEITVDFSNEEAFRAFLLSDSVEVLADQTSVDEVIDTYDSGYLMYRWKVTMDVNTLSKQINATIRNRYNVNKASILTLIGKDKSNQPDGSRVIDGQVFSSVPVSSIGKVQDMKVITRGSSGIIKELMIKGTENTVLVCYQTNVRTLLAPVATEVIRLDGSSVNGMSLLPSAFFVIDRENKDGKATSFTFHGGGFGHGVGMSQNGVKAMVKLGKTHEEILKHYYQGTTIELIYRN